MKEETLTNDLKKRLHNEDKKQVNFQWLLKSEKKVYQQSNSFYFFQLFPAIASLQMQLPELQSYIIFAWPKNWVIETNLDYKV